MKKLQDIMESEDFPDFENMSHEEKSSLISEFLEEIGKACFAVFKMFDLKTYMECKIINDGTNEQYKISFNRIEDKIEDIDSLVYKEIFQRQNLTWDQRVKIAGDYAMHCVKKRIEIFIIYYNAKALHIIPTYTRQTK